MATTIALLKGVNVGGNKLVKMADLRSMLEFHGFPKVKTLLQSGNVVLTSESSDPSRLEMELSDLTHSHFGVRSEYFVRTLREWEELIASNPFEKEAKEDPSHLLVVVRKEPATDQDVEEFQRAIVGPERIASIGKQIYAVFPEGIGTSKLDRTPGYRSLMGSGTARNWNTVGKLLTLAKEFES